MNCRGRLWREKARTKEREKTLVFGVGAQRVMRQEVVKNGRQTKSRPERKIVLLSERNETCLCAWGEKRRGKVAKPSRGKKVSPTA